MRRMALAFVVSGGLVAGAQAATVGHFTSKEGRDVITLAGEITSGDTDRFVALVKDINAAGREVSGIRLNSPGGVLLEGAKLADAVRFAKVATVVMNGTLCASACFVVFAAGTEKYVSYSAQVGVHGASTSGGEDSAEANAATIVMAKIVKELGVPPAIIGQMVVTPPDKMVWLSASDLQSMGVKMTGKPAQTASAGSTPVQATPLAQTQPGAPTQLVPNSAVGLLGASLPASKDEGWKQMVNAALAQSAAQNAGQARTARSCQPEIKVCNIAVMFKGINGKSMMLRVSTDADDKLVSRDICTFNDFGDVRECLDFDKEVTTKAMKNAASEWIAIGN